MSSSSTVTLIAGHYFHWGVISISMTNLVIIISTVVVFILALLVPFPHRQDDDDPEARR
ncbi:MAG: hypothetical protein M3Z50_08070 [Actinomycetota bacterium]|nr:hypothetical protein [Actinomycetota bacterium]